jgi:hypothetical protein
LRDCDRCGSFCVLDDHVCPPRYVVWCPDDGSTEDDGKTFRANSPSGAAEQWAEWNDRHSADYNIVKGCGAVVHVRSEDGGETSVFTVTGETVPLYSARLMAMPVRAHDAEAEEVVQG